MRGEEVQLLGAVAPGLANRSASSATPAPTTSGRRCTSRQDPEFPDRDDRRAVQSLKEHSILADLLRERASDNQVFRERRATRSSTNRSRPSCSRSGRDVLLGQMKKENAASYASGLLIGTDVRIGLQVPTGARVMVMGRPE